MPFPGEMDVFRLNVVLFGMLGSRKSSLINTIFKSLAVAQPAVINDTGRESATLRLEARGFFTFTKWSYVGIKLTLNGLVYP